MQVCVGLTARSHPHAKGLAWLVRYFCQTAKNFTCIKTQVVRQCSNNLDWAVDLLSREVTFVILWVQHVCCYMYWLHAELLALLHWLIWPLPLLLLWVVGKWAGLFEFLVWFQQKDTGHLTGWHHHPLSWQLQLLWVWAMSLFPRIRHLTGFSRCHFRCLQSGILQSLAATNSSSPNIWPPVRDDCNAVCFVNGLLDLCLHPVVLFIQQMTR